MSLGRGDEGEDEGHPVGEAGGGAGREGHTWGPRGHVVLGPGITEVGLQRVDVGLAHHGLLAEVLIVHHLQHQGQRKGLLRRHVLQPRTGQGVRPFILFCFFQQRGEFVLFFICYHLSIIIDTRQTIFN